MGQRYHDQLVNTIAQQFPQLADTLVIGAIASTNRDRSFI